MRILILGGYGYFGSMIARMLALEENIEIVIAGRDADKAKAFADSIGAYWMTVDVEKENFPEALKVAAPQLVIHTGGPFQERGYGVARACIAQGCHYIDLGDGRGFVGGIAALDAEARAAGVCVISGASSVPALTSAIMDRYAPAFAQIEDVDYAIATAQRTNPGLATTAAILGYAGKPFTTLQGGREVTVYGWQSLKARKYPGLGWRLLGNCDVPDLALFPERYPGLKSLRFRAGLEVPALHMGLWALSWLVRAGIVNTLRPLASAMLRAGKWFDVFGSARSGFHMEMKGPGHDGRTKIVTFTILTDQGHGPYIPCIPSVVIALRLARGQDLPPGAGPCMGIVDIDAYMAALSPFAIKWMVDEKTAG